MELTTNSISYIRHVSRLFVRELGHLESQHGLTLTQTHILVELEKHGALNVKRLSELLNVDISTMSRTVKRLLNIKYISMTTDRRDKRAKLVALTDQGRKKLLTVNTSTNQSVAHVLDNLNVNDRRMVEKGLDIYVNALTKHRIMSEFSIRPIDPSDNIYLARVIRTVLAEYGNNRHGELIDDNEMDRMYEAYSQPNAAYFVVMHGETVVGGAGLNQLTGAGATVCEIQKMYLLEESRGLGLGVRLLESCLQKAKELGYKMCYVETLMNMTRAHDLYRGFGFKPTTSPNYAGSGSSNYWMLKVLT